MDPLVAGATPALAAADGGVTVWANQLTAPVTAGLPGIVAGVSCGSTAVIFAVNASSLAATKLSVECAVGAELDMEEERMSVRAANSPAKGSWVFEKPAFKDDVPSTGSLETPSVDSFCVETI